MKKIICFCSAGFGSSLILKINVKKALDSLGVRDVLVENTSLDNLSSIDADIYICATDLEKYGQRYGKTVALRNIMAVKDIAEKLAFLSNDDE